MRLCYVNKAAFGKPSGHLRMRAGCLEKQSCAERVRTQAPNSTSTEGRGVGDLSSIASGQWLNSSFLCNEPSTKTQKDGVQRDSGLVTTRSCWGVVQGGPGSPLPSPGLAPAHRFWVIAFYNALVTVGNLALQVKWRRKRQPTPVPLPGTFHDGGILGHKESDTTEQLRFHFLFPFFGTPVL